jgi:hypothetical protein
MKKQPTIADVLHYAADKCLLADNRYTEGSGKEKFSCCAVHEAVWQLSFTNVGVSEYDLKHRVITGLNAMGCDTGSASLFKQYGDMPDMYENINHKVQGMRYMWLKWAALMAEEQGV